MTPKNPPLRHPRLRDTRGEPCQLCGLRDDTVVGAHYQGMYSNRLGKGERQKPTDLAIIAACHRCHAMVDSYVGGNTAERAAHLLALALERSNRIIQELIEADK